nr:DNA helicase PIF1, ATP-dependent [Tanacetum cinerariifolium]
FSQLNELNQDSVNQQHLNEKSVSTANKIPLEYSSLGKCICACRYCGAKFWECEKVVSTSNSKNFVYNKCCYGRRTVLRPTSEYPQYIKELYKDKHFMENIHAYNQMFSMTSLGANVDSSVNNGKGPYVFRVSSLIYHWIGSIQPDEGQAPRLLQLYIHDTANEVNNRMANFGDEHESLLKKLDSHNALVQLFRTARNKYMEVDIPEFKFRLYNVIGTRQIELPTAETIGAIVFAKTSGTENDFDLIIEEHSRFLQRVSIYDAVLRGDRDANNLRLRTVLTASFTGGPRYMYAHYLDALAICRVHGSPSFFITFTCNAKWLEIEEFIKPFPQLTTADRADIVDRVFEKKRGLPHCHSLLWIETSSKVKQAIDFDLYVSAELPDLKVDTNGHRIISELMIHGPCVYANRNASCMKDESRCNRNFPKAYCDKTYIDKDGFVHYRRRDTGIQTQRQSVWLDNQYVVTYNRTLCMRYYAHINVEYCGWTMLIKYLFKYISKGTDRVIVNVTRPTATGESTTNVPAIQVEEIKNYVEARYIGPHEACWRILDFPIHYRNPRPVQWDSADVTQLLDKVIEARIITGTRTSEKACEALGLIGGDEEWTMALQEAAGFATASELRRLFVHILIFCNVSNPINLWQKSWQNLCDDVPRKLSKRLRISQIERNAKKMQAIILFDIQLMLNSYSKSLEDFGLPTPPQDMLPILQNRLLREETNYNPEVLLKEKNLLILRLNKEQKLIFNEIITAVQDNVQKLIFIYGHGGTGKTFLWKAITTALRSEEKIVLAVASSGIASLLLPSGGDFRQTLPVKKKASKPEIIDASITSSYLWEGFKIYTLTQNMHLYQSDLTEAQKQCLYQFSTWLLDIGNGNIGTPGESETKDIFNVYIPIQLCIPNSDMALTELINFIYDDMALQTPTVEDLQKKAIVAPTNESADMINAHVLSLVNHKQRIYLSSDEAIPHGNDGGESELLYPAEYLNSLNFSGFPPHMLQLKVGAPIILLCNLNIAAGLCNGTRKMTEPINPTPNQIDKGKLPLVDVTTVTITYIKPAQVDQAIETKTWDRTLPNDITLIFGRYTSFIPIPNDNFPEHYFNFIAYNEVDARADVSGAPLTVVCSFHFKYGVKQLKALISMHMKKCQSQSSLSLVQLGQQNATEINATSATYYYLNPEIPETSHILNVAIIDDGTTTTTITCFSPDAHTFVPDCNSVVNSIEDKDTYHVPSILSQAEGHRYIFQYHFGKKAKPRRPNFTLNVVLKLSTQPLLALPEPESSNSPAAKILEGSSTTTNPPSTTEGHLPTATAKDNVTEVAKDLEKKESQCNMLFSKNTSHKTRNQGTMPKKQNNIFWSMEDSYK